jgi:hypothetical protein
MTLNITILSPVGIHQSADFQLSELQRDAPGKRVPLPGNSAMVVTLLSDLRKLLR